MGIIQIGKITNIFGGGDGGGGGLSAAFATVVMAGSVTVAAMALVPVLLAATGALLALATVLFALGHVLFGTAAVIGSVTLPITAHQYAKGRAIERENITILRHNLTVVDNREGIEHRRERRASRPALPPKTIYVSSTVGDVETREIAR